MGLSGLGSLPTLSASTQRVMTSSSVDHDQAGAMESQLGMRLGTMTPARGSGSFPEESSTLEVLGHGEVRCRPEELDLDSMSIGKGKRRADLETSTMPMAIPSPEARLDRPDVDR